MSKSDVTNLQCTLQGLEMKLQLQLSMKAAQKPGGRWRPVMEPSWYISRHQ